MVSLVAAMVCCYQRIILFSSLRFQIHASLDNWTDGHYQKKGDFRAEAYEDVYNGHFMFLSDLKAEKPIFFHKLMSGLYNEVAWVFLYLLYILSEQSTNLVLCLVQRRTSLHTLSLGTTWLGSILMTSKVDGVSSSVNSSTNLTHMNHTIQPSLFLIHYLFPYLHFIIYFSYIINIPYPLSPLPHHTFIW